MRHFSRQEVAALYQLRTILHEASALRIAIPASPQWLDELKAAQHAHAQAVAQGKLGEIFLSNTLFHRKLFEGTGNPYLVEAIELSNAKTHGIRSHGLGAPTLLRKAEEEHLQMVEAVEAGRLDELARLCVTHMGPAREFYEEKYCRATD